MKTTADTFNIIKIYAYYTDTRAAYALISDSAGFKVWRLRGRQTEHGVIDAFLADIDYPEKQFKDIGAFVGYCKLKHYDICVG